MHEPRTVTVEAPSRLHFGMFSVGGRSGRRFGGVGAMIDTPGLRLSVSPAAEWAFAGPLSERARRIAQQLRETSPDIQRQGACRIEIHHAPPEHVGLGVGTQLSLAVAAGVLACLRGASLEPVKLAPLVGRGRRSAVGIHGFGAGGLIIERGKEDDDEIAPLAARYAIPSEWRFVIAVPQGPRGMAGDAEQRAFDQLTPTPAAVTDRLMGLALDEIAPAAQVADFVRFSSALGAFGTLAGECFAPIQGGTYGHAATAELVRQLRQMGAVGVGQTSWGPATFALAESDTQAADFAARLGRTEVGRTAKIWIARANNVGALVQMAR